MHVYLIGFSPRFRQGRLERCQLRRAQRLHLLHLLKRGPDQYRIGGTCRKDMRLRQQSAAARQVPIHLGQKWGSGYRRTTEDIHKGYIEMPSTPLFAFGHGLSYTTFEYSPLELVSDTVDVGGEARMSLTITNTGKRRGTEVVQLYAADTATGVTLPAQQLIGFARVDLEPGPVVLGHGKPYLAGPRPPLRLVARDRIGEDVIRLVYVPA